VTSTNFPPTCASDNSRSLLVLHGERPPGPAPAAGGKAEDERMSEVWRKT
jgi:hypothetical protein